MWYKGQRIVCVNDKPLQKSPNRFLEYLKEGEKYIIEEIDEWPDGLLSFYLVGLDTGKYSYREERFKPLDGDISVFEKILEEVNRREKCLS